MKFIVTRLVTPEEDGDWLHRTFHPGEELYEFDGATYGCIDWNNGLAVSEVESEYPFFQFPYDAVERAS